MGPTDDHQEAGSDRYRQAPHAADLADFRGPWTIFRQESATCPTKGA